VALLELPELLLLELFDELPQAAMARASVTARIGPADLLKNIDCMSSSCIVF
jgi:hypothetical protein